jgi:uncharacterized protein YqeY
MERLEQLEDDLKRALKERDARKVGVLRLAIAALRNARIEKREDLTDEETMEVVRRQVRLRKEAASEYRKGGSEERAAEEDAEREILQSYLPPELSDDELRAAIAEAVEQTGATGPRELGKVMGAVMPRFKGRVDGARVRALAQEALQPPSEEKDGE